MFAFKSLLDMPRGEALAVVVALIAAMGYTIISLEWLPHMSIIAAIVVLILYGLARGFHHFA
ncbi:putative membrane protein [Neisseria meningitidis 97018]|nr:putative membrane protein [Neisseria meningitidis 97018]